MTTLSAKEKADFAALDEADRRTQIKARLRIIRVAAFSGTLDRSSIDVALDELDALTDEAKATEPAAPAATLNPFKPAPAQSTA